MSTFSDHQRVETGREANGRFGSGNSGNPRGRPAGSRNKASLAVESMLDGEAERLTRKVVELAQNGDLTALKLCLDRILPPRRERLLQFQLPSLSSSSDAPKAIAALLQSVAEGEITLGEATELAKLVEMFLKFLDATEHEERLMILEDKQLLGR